MDFVDSEAEESGNESHEEEEEDEIISNKSKKKKKIGSDEEDEDGEDIGILNHIQNSWFSSKHLQGSKQGDYGQSGQGFILT